MRIGIAFDLRQEYLDQGYTAEQTAEFDKEETIAGIEQALAELGHQPERIGNAQSLARALTDGRRWDLVFNFSEGLYGLGRESLVPCLLEAWRVPYTFSDPLVLAVCLHKGVCKRVVRDLGLPTADFAVVETPGDAARVDLPFPLFIKPVAEGTGKGITARSVIHDRAALAEGCAELLARFEQAVLVERYLPGREFTVGVVGTGAAARVVGGMEVLFKAHAEATYSTVNKENYLEMVEYRAIEPASLRDALHALSLAAWRGLGCRDGGRVDLRLDEHDRPQFLEVNPLAGLNPIHSDLPILGRMHGWSFLEIMRAILDSALTRVPGATRHPA